MGNTIPAAPVEDPRKLTTMPDAYKGINANLFLITSYICVNVFVSCQQDQGSEVFSYKNVFFKLTPKGEEYISEADMFWLSS